MMAFRLFGAKPLSEAMLPFCQLDPKEYISMIFFLSQRKMSSAKWWPLCIGLNVLSKFELSKYVAYTRLQESFNEFIE